MTTDNEDEEGKTEFLGGMIFLCMHIPIFHIWFPDAPNLLSDLYSSTVIFFVELIT